MGACCGKSAKPTAVTPDEGDQAICCAQCGSIAQLTIDVHGNYYCAKCWESWEAANANAAAAGTKDAAIASAAPANEASTAPAAANSATPSTSSANAATTAANPRPQPQPQLKSVSSESGKDNGVREMIERSVGQYNRLEKEQRAADENAEALAARRASNACQVD